MFLRARRILSLLYGRHLFLTNTLSCGALLALGDGAQQCLERRGSHGRKHDWPRTFRMFTIGFAIGPLSHGWYTFLDRIYPQRTARIICRKILLDQVCISPVMAFTFLVGMSKLEGNTNNVAMDEFSDKFATVYAADWCVWPLANALNFALIMPRFRVLYIYCVDVVWYTFNSYVKHRSEPITTVEPVQSLLNTYEELVPRLQLEVVDEGEKES